MVDRNAMEESLKFCADLACCDLNRDPIITTISTFVVETVFSGIGFSLRVYGDQFSVQGRAGLDSSHREPRNGPRKVDGRRATGGTPSNPQWSMRFYTIYTISGPLSELSRGNILEEVTLVYASIGLLPEQRDRVL